MNKMLANNNVDDMEILSNFYNNKLCERIENFQNRTYDSYEKVISKIGPNLTTLSLDESQFAILFKFIGKYCRNLEKFHLNINYSFHNLINLNYSFSNKLKEFKLTYKCKISQKLITTLLGKLPYNVESIKIENVKSYHLLISDVIVQFKRLRILHIGVLQLDKIDYLMSELNDLEELAFGLSTRSDDTIISIIVNVVMKGEKLKRLKLIDDGGYVHFYLSDKWSYCYLYEKIVYICKLRNASIQIYVKEYIQKWWIRQLLVSQYKPFYVKILPHSQLL